MPLDELSESDIVAQQTDSGANNDLEALLSRINQLTGSSNPSPSEAKHPASPMQETTAASDSKPYQAASRSATPAYNRDDLEDTDADYAPEPVTSKIHVSLEAETIDSQGNSWRPLEPKSLREAGVGQGQLEHLILKCLGACGDMTGHQLADQHAIPFRLIDPVLQDLKQAQLVAYRGAAPMNDYVYQLTDLGRERAKKLTEYCSYFGAAPVPLEAYIESVGLQTLTQMHPTETDLKHAFSDLLVNQRMLRRLGPAVNSGRGLFLFGAPGNGKTSIAERITKAFGDTVWVPRAIGIDGEIMRVFDPGLHEEVPLEERSGPLQVNAVDNRWVRIRRPTIVAGGELTMDALEVMPSTGKNVSEAPLQLKSNCGTLVIDDFGRQRMTTDELLNRWIVPLEKRYDFLRLVNGKKIQVPFDQLIIFSTNLEPRDLVDDAFLRRIPYKIEVPDPSEEEFRKLFEIMAPIVGLEFNQEALDYLIEAHYKPINRPFRCCQPRDLLLQIRNYCFYLDSEPLMCKEYFDYAVENYFAVM